MSNKQQCARIPEKAQVRDKKYVSEDRPEAAGSDSDVSVPAPLPSTHVTVGSSAASGIKSDDAKVLQKVEKIEARQLNMEVKQQSMEERVAKLEGGGHQVKVPSKAEPRGDSEPNTTPGNLFTSSASMQPAKVEPKGTVEHIEEEYVIQDLNTHSIQPSKLPENYDKEAWMASTLMQTQDGLNKTAKLVQAMQEREEQRQQTTAATAALVKNMLTDQQQMQREQKEDRKRIERNEEKIEELSDRVDRMSSTSSANSSFSASSPGMDKELSASLVQPVCATLLQADLETSGAVSDKDELVVHVLASQSDPGPLVRHNLKSKQKQSAWEAESSSESTVLMKLKKVEATQEKILAAVQHKEQVSSSDPDHDTTVTSQPEEETNGVKPGTSKSTPPHFPTM